MFNNTLSVAVRRFAPPSLACIGLALAAACGSPQTLAEMVDETPLAPLSGRALVAQGAQKLTPARSDRFCMQTQDGSTDNGAAVILGPCDGTQTQVWTAKNGTLVTGNNKCLDVADGKRDNGAKLQIWDCGQYNSNQRFTVSGGSIAWTDNNKCLDLTDGAAQAGTPLQLWDCVDGSTNQSWNNVGNTAPAGNAAAPSTSGYLRTDGARIVDASGREVILRGPNIGGWLVPEAWMNGFTDWSDTTSTSSGNSHGRFAQDTLEARFGVDKAKTLMDAWYDNFITGADLDKIKDMGFNTIRVPFGFRNLMRADGAWIKDAAGKIDYTRMDWIVDQAQARGLYVILDYHVWQTQRQNYDLISQNSDAGRAAQAQAAKIWKQVTRHYKGNSTIAAFDVLNEPTGSYANAMQDAMYKAVRAEDADRIIVMESMHADPASLGWQQVVYSIHQYGMMGTDFGTNQASFNSDLNGDIADFRRFNIPTYVGEFMVQDTGPTLTWLMTQYRDQKLHWSSWTYKTVNMGSWGYYNLPGSSAVNLSSDSFESLLNTWTHMPEPQPQTNLINAVKDVFGGR